MEVIYETPIADRIRNAVFEADKSRRVISKIILTFAEMRELTSFLDRYVFLPPLTPNGISKYMGVFVECENPSKSIHLEYPVAH